MRGSGKPILFRPDLLLLLAFLTGAGSPPLPSQEAKSNLWTPAMFAAEGFVRLDVSVDDPSGKRVTGLSPDDFTLLDNGQPSEILSVHAFNGTTAKPETPVELILVFDHANDYEPEVMAAAKALGDFFQRIQEPLGTPVSIVRISKNGSDETPRPIGDGAVLARILAHPDQSDFVPLSRSRPAVLARGATLSERNLTIGESGQVIESQNVLPVALNALGAIAIRARRSPGRKLLFWIGPDWTASRKGPVRLQGAGVADWIAEFSTRLREARIALYFDPSLFHPGSPPIQGTSLSDIHSAVPLLDRNLSFEPIARRTGGGVLEPGSFDSFVGLRRLESFLAETIRDADDYYSLTFAAPRTNQIDEYHQLKLEVNRPDLTVSTSAGYFDEPVYYDQPPPLRPVTIAQFEHELSPAKQMSDRECARVIEGVELTERMSSARLRSWEARMPGRRSRSALTALADLSVFLDAPPDDVVAQPAPDASARKQMLARAVDYLNQAIPRLPDFFAVRTTSLFDQTALANGDTWKTAIADQSLHAAETTKTTIVLRHGREVVEKEASRTVETLRTEGAFGPVLATAYTVAASAGGKVKWLRWERDSNGTLAVFGYLLDANNALLETGFCCVADAAGAVSFLRFPPVHGELAIDPQSGAIRRITTVADFTPRLPLDQSAIAVEYSPLTIGGNLYVCPVRSVSFQRQRTIRAIDEWGESFRIYGPFETILNDMTFERYHLFHSNVHILPGFTPTDSQ